MWLVIDKKRVAKTLLATHPVGRRPVLQLHLNEHEEAAFVATEIKHLVAATGGMLEWGDFVVLRKSLRSLMNGGPLTNFRDFHLSYH